MALLLGLGVMGVVLSNLLAGEGGSSNNAIATLPRAGQGSSEERYSEVRAQEAPAQEAPAHQTPAHETPTQARDTALGVGIYAANEPPRLWGHPAPLAKLIALIAVSGALLTSVIWGVGWLLVQAITRSLAGG